MRKISHFIHLHSESVFCMFQSEKNREFISNADPQSATPKPSGFCYLTKYTSLSRFRIL